MEMEINIQLLGYVALAMLSLYVIYIRFQPSMNLPPGPHAWPVIGHLHLLGTLPHRSLDRLSKTYGPLMSIQLGSVPCIVASSPEMAREILKTSDLTFASRPKIAAGKYTVYNYSDITWSPYGEHWRQARKICLLELFSTKRVESYEYIRVEEVDRMVASVFKSSAAAEPVHLREETFYLSNNIISRMVLGRRYLDENGGNKMKPREFMEMLEEEVVEEHDQQRKSVPDYVPADMVDVLLQQSDDPANNLTREKIKAFTEDMIATGTETSATLVEWALAELLKNPHNLAKANEEMDRVVGKERWVQEKDIGYDIPANTRAFVNVWTIGRDERVWEKAEEFRPERFEGSSLDVKSRDYELLPFGSGRRMCPGASLGLKVVQLGLANLLHGFHWRLPANIQSTQDLDMSESFGLTTPKAEPLVAMAEPRLPAHLYRFP
ncbi:hypothetical protein SUGI_0177210 [Cryptomeria japonica]|nr:hypothetical protein SUGI_0177210 [Cryptomeria japonica]